MVHDQNKKKHLFEFDIGLDPAGNKRFLENQILLETKHEMKHGA